MTKRPKAPLSTYDPKYKEPKMANFNFGGPSMRDNSPQRHGLDPKNPRRICYCGDPNCPAGIQDGNFGSGGSYSGNSRSDSIRDRIRDLRRMSNSPDDFMARLSYEGIMMSNLPPEAQNLVRSYVRDYMAGGRSLNIAIPSAPTPSGPPSSYTAARKEVKDYILTTSQSTDWSDIIGNETAHRALREALEAPVIHRELYEHYSMKPPKGVLLYGPPGCGKTMFAKAAATAVVKLYKSEASEVILVKGSQLQQPYVGMTEQIIRNIFLYAREYAAYHKHPLVIFMDECEVFLPDRNGKGRRVQSWEESNVATMLAEMDGLETLGAFIILATNRPEALDEALLRDGRCDRKIKIERPSREAIHSIVLKSLSSAPLQCQAEEFAEAVTECFYDPAYVINHGHLLRGVGDKLLSNTAVNFCLEHIVSGAMVQGVISRAKAIAFRRDLSEGTVTGIRVLDGIHAVKEIFEENKGLEHNFALQEFSQNLPIEEMLEPKGRIQ